VNVGMGNVIVGRDSMCTMLLMSFRVVRTDVKSAIDRVPLFVDKVCR
jgi:hypothetical protein